MNAHQRGAEILTKEINRLDDLRLLRDDLEKIGSLEQTVKETESRMSTLRAEEAAAKANLAEAQKATKAAKDGAALATKQATAEAERIVADARDEAAAIQAEAQHKVDVFVDGANARARAIEADIAAANGKRNAALAEVKDAEKKLADVQRQRKAMAESLAG